MRPRDGNDLDLQALAYINAELDEAQAAEFEARLAEDQEAREAVERAVLIGSAVVRARLSPKAVTAPRFGWRSMAGLAAAVLVLAVGLNVYFGSGAGVGHGDVVVATEAEAQELIASWVALADLGDDAEIEFEQDDVDVDLVVPGWLVEAVEEDRDR